jgi:hypothetical protein
MKILLVYWYENLILLISVDPHQRQVVDKCGSEAKTERFVSMDLPQVQNSVNIDMLIRLRI